MKTKNYTTYTNENEIPTHEETFGFTRASLRSVAEHRFKDNFLCLTTIDFLPNENYPNPTSSDFFKPLVKLNREPKIKSKS